MELCKKCGDIEQLLGLFMDLKPFCQILDRLPKRNVETGIATFGPAAIFSHVNFNFVKALVRNIVGFSSIGSTQIGIET